MATTDWQGRICRSPRTWFSRATRSRPSSKPRADHRESLTVACLGPLTNLAVALRLEPRLGQWIGQVTLMGGSDGVGHMTPTTEFNFWCDPEAASIVCGSGANVRVVGYDVTRHIGFSADEIATLSQVGLGLPPGWLAMFAASISNDSKRYGGCRILRFTARWPSCCGETRPRADTPAFDAGERAGNFTRGMSVYDDRPLASLTIPPFERLPPGEVECTVG